VSTTTGPLTVVGTVIKPGSRIAFAEAVVLDGQGRTVATASSTLLVFPIERTA
jgi:acyl-coenzyme A thioesterase PaaI-like protein